MKSIVSILLACLVQAFSLCMAAPIKKGPAIFFAADDPYIEYMGRIDVSDPKKPRFWSPGVTVRLKFSGSSCRVLLNDEMIWGKDHNYVEIVLDDSAYRIQMKGRQDTLTIVARGAEDGHVLTLCKDTESGIGWLEFAGLFCEGMLPPPPLPIRKIEFIGNSITCGAGMDESVTPCGQGKWYDQHNAWLSYGAVTARALNAQWYITAVSGIGLMHSCCNMGEIVMPRVFDKIDQRVDSLAWDFTKYQPDVVTVCLGQNDGVQDSAVFRANYIQFLETIRKDYPSAKIVCLTSPMGDERLTSWLKEQLAVIAARRRAAGDKNVYSYFYSKRYFHGCGTHPNMKEHEEIAKELTAYLKKIMGW